MLSSGLRMPVGPRSPSGTWGPRTKTLSDASGASRFTGGSSSSQWVSTPPITPGMPRRSVTAIFMPFASERVAVDDDAKRAQQDHRFEPQRPVAHIFQVGGEPVLAVARLVRRAATHAHLLQTGHAGRAGGRQAKAPA